MEKLKTAFLVTAVAVSIVAAAAYGRGGGLDTPFSDEANHWLVKNWTWYGQLFGPFARLSETEFYELSGARHRVRMTFGLYNYQAWEREGRDAWCLDQLKNGVFVDLAPVPGTTYRTLLELDQEFRSTTELVASAFALRCINYNSFTDIPLHFAAPRVDRDAMNNSLRIEALIVVATNNRIHSVKTISIRWEVGALGRPDVITSGESSEEIVGGLLPGEEYRFKNIGFGRVERSRLERFVRRTGVDDLYILACIQSADGDPSSYFDRNQTSCLENRKRESESFLELRLAVPDVREIVSDSRLFPNEIKEQT